MQGRGSNIYWLHCEHNSNPYAGELHSGVSLAMVMSVPCTTDANVRGVLA